MVLIEVSIFYKEFISVYEVICIVFEFGKMLRISQDIFVSVVNKFGFWEFFKFENCMVK